MDIQNTQEYKAAKDLERALNDYGWSPERFAESTRCFHRTLQQNLVQMEKPRDFDPFGQAGFAHLWLQYD